MPILITSGALPWKHINGFPKPFSYRKVCTSGLHTFTIFNPSSTLDQLPTTCLIGSTVEPASITQLTQDRLVQAELALRYWREHQNLFIWATIPPFTSRTDFPVPGACPHPKVATPVELPFHLSIFPSEERPFETPGHEYKRSVWHGDIMAPCPSSFHSNQPSKPS